MIKSIAERLTDLEEQFRGFVETQSDIYDMLARADGRCDILTAACDVLDKKVIGVSMQAQYAMLEGQDREDMDMKLSAHSDVIAAKQEELNRMVEKFNAG